MATIEEQYAQRQADNQATYNARQAENQATYDARQAEAQNTYNERQAKAQDTYTQRLNEGNGQIKDMMGKSLESQKIQYQNMLNQGIAAQEEARAGLEKQFQQGANDLSIQYERNRRNLNMQALARGLNTGAASQQQLGLHGGYMGGYGKLLGEKVSQNAGIDRAIANLKTDVQGKIAQAIADNDYKTAAMLFENYNNQVSRLDARDLANQNYLDTQVANNRNYLDSMKMNNQNRLDTVSDRNQNWRDSMTMDQAQILASYGNFDGYAALGYDQNTINNMKQMWIAQNPQLAWQTGQIDDATYRKWLAGPGAANTGGGGGGGYYGGGGGSRAQDLLTDPQAAIGAYRDANGNIITAEDVGWGNTKGTLGLPEFAQPKSSASKSGVTGYSAGDNKVRSEAGQKMNAQRH